MTHFVILPFCEVVTLGGSVKSNLERWSKKKLGEAKRKWLGELPSVLWSYRSTPRKASKETPFSMAFETKVLMLVKERHPLV